MSKGVIRRLLGRLGGGPTSGTTAPTEEEARHSLVGPAQLWRMKRDFQIDFLRRQGLRPSDRVLDLGCGTLRGGVPIIEYVEPGHYVGVDSREQVIGEAWKELRANGLEDRRPVLLAAPDLSTVEVPGPFDVIWAFSVLIHMEDPVAESAFGLAARALRESGVFYLNVNAGSRGDRGKWQGFPIVTRPLSFYVDLGASHGLVVRDLGALEMLGHRSGSVSQDAQRMLACSRAGGTRLDG